MPQTNSLTVISDGEMLATVRRYLPLIPDATLTAHIRVFRQICHQNKVILLQATPIDYAIIQQRQAIGWSDDRP